MIKSAQYIYDVYDQRIAKIVDPDGMGALPAVTERFVYGSNQNIALVFDGNGTLTHRYLFGDGIDQIEADEQVATGTTLWALPDHLGSVREELEYQQLLAILHHSLIFHHKLNPFLNILRQDLSRQNLRFLLILLSMNQYYLVKHRQGGKPRVSVETFDGSIHFETE